MNLAYRIRETYVVRRCHLRVRPTTSSKFKYDGGLASPIIIRGALLAQMSACQNPRAPVSQSGSIASRRLALESRIGCVTIAIRIRGVRTFHARFGTPIISRGVVARGRKRKRDREEGMNNGATRKRRKHTNPSKREMKECVSARERKRETIGMQVARYVVLGHA